MRAKVRRGQLWVDNAGRVDGCGVAACAKGSLMLGYNVQTWWYVDAWRKIASTWGSGGSWTRVYAYGPFRGDGRAADSAFSEAMAEEFGALVRTFQWNGQAWEQDPQRSFEPFS